MLIKVSILTEKMVNPPVPKNTGVILPPYLPTMANSLQQPLSPIPNLTIVKMFTSR